MLLVLKGNVLLKVCSHISIYWNKQFSFIISIIHLREIYPLLTHMMLLPFAQIQSDFSQNIESPIYILFLSEICFPH